MNRTSKVAMIWMVGKAGEVFDRLDRYSKAFDKMQKKSVAYNHNREYTNNSERMLRRRGN